jgi:hypothetical protein
MKLSTLITDVKLAVDNSTSSRWSDADCARKLNSHIHTVVRKLSELDEGYMNYQFNLLGASAVQRYSNEWVYTLPRWVMKVVEVREKANATDLRGRVYPVLTKFQRGTTGWQFISSTKLLLKGYSTAPDLTLDCVKLPALLTRGTLPAQTGGSPTPSTTIVRLDLDTSAEALLYPHETEPNGYAGALFEFTGVSTSSHIVGGQLRECVGSQHLVDNGSAVLYTLVSFEDALTVQPAASDTYEMHAQIGDEHLRLVVLLAARDLLGIEQNTDGVRIVSQELAEQWQLFREHAQRRQIQEPHVMGQLYTQTAENYWSSGLQFYE